MSIQSVSDYAAKSVEYLKESNNVVLFWVKYKPSYVSVDKRVVLRIRNPSRFGERMQGLTRENGALQEVNWETALKRFSPHVIEIYGSSNPLPFLVHLLSTLTTEKESFYAHVNQLMLHRSPDTRFDDLAELLNCVNILSVFSFSGTRFSADEFDALLGHLDRLNVRAMSMSSNLNGAEALNKIFSKLQLEVVGFSSESGICTSDLMKCETKCPETRICYLQERCFDLSESEDTILNAVVVLQQVLRIFPNLFALIFDWNIVEPFDERSVEIVKKLIDIYRELKLRALLIPCYTPYKEPLDAVSNICLEAAREDVPCQQRRFASKGVEKHNFSLITFGECTSEFVIALNSVFVEKRMTTIDDLSVLLSALDTELPSSGPRTDYVDEAATLTLDFGGFRRAEVEKKFTESIVVAEKQQNQMCGDVVNQMKL